MAPAQGKDDTHTHTHIEKCKQLLMLRVNPSEASSGAGPSFYALAPDLYV